jgi:hypothetical protein
VTRRIVLAISLLALLALTAGPAGAVGAAAGASPSVRGVAATESAPVTGATPGPGPLRSSALAPGPGGSVSASAAWRIVTSPNKGPIDNHLQEVSCVNTTKCVAVGYDVDPISGLRQSVVAALVNGTWKNQQIPQRGTASNTFWNVSCVVGNRCFAVGYYFDIPTASYRTLIASYAGGYWSLVASPSVANTDNYLFGIDCVDATHCVAVGRYYHNASQRYRSLVLTLTGTSWAITPSPNRSTATQNNFLADVSCGDATHCIAVGYSLTDAGVYSTVALERNGSTWSLRSSRNVEGLSNVLRDVSCPTPTECVAVGATDTATVALPNNPEVTLIERFAAGAWTIEPSPNRAGTDNHLWGVSCPSAASCVAVGQSQTIVPVGQTPPTTARSWTLVLTYDLGTWTQTPSPSKGGTYNFQYGLSCPNVSNCVSSGEYINLGTGRTRSLILTNS